MSSTPGLCPLCLQPGLLRESHIIPEAWYKPAYDEKHRLLTVGHLPTAKPDVFIQKGITVELLCDTCERLIDRTYERPFLTFWSSANALPDLLSQDKVLVRVPDPKLLKLFLLSVVWRAAAAGTRIQEWEPVVISSHLERIRSMLLAQDAGHESEYPIVAVAMVNDDNEVLRPLIGPPYSLTVDAIQIVDVVFGGCLWRTHCAPPGLDVRIDPADFLQYSGDFWIRRKPACDYPPLLHAMAMNAARQLVIPNGRER